MGYPERLLSDGERIEAQFRPHWSRLIREGIVVVVGIGLTVLAAILDWPAWAYAVIWLAVLVAIIGGVVKWATTLHVITNERVIYRAGLIAKVGKEIPHEVINDVAFNQSAFERIFGTGDLLIESAGTHGQTRYSDIPRPESVQTLIYRVREERMRDMNKPDPSSTWGRRPTTGEVEPEASPQVSRVAELETLARLHSEGKLSDAEYESEKRRLLEG
jgi:uncharacterized membrane protein YdbT with pleckstrin-like domain